MFISCFLIVRCLPVSRQGTRQESFSYVKSNSHGSFHVFLIFNCIFFMFQLLSSVFHFWVSIFPLSFSTSPVLLSRCHLFFSASSFFLFMFLSPVSISHVFFPVSHSPLSMFRFSLFHIPVSGFHFCFTLFNFPFTPFQVPFALLNAPFSYFLLSFVLFYCNMAGSGKICGFFPNVNLTV
jgi:hypothetical protein